MENLYEILLGRPRAAPAANNADASPAPFAWDAADGAGPDRLFNRYRRLRLDAVAGFRAPDKTLRARRGVEDSTPVRQDAATQPWEFC